MTMDLSVTAISPITAWDQQSWSGVSIGKVDQQDTAKGDPPATPQPGRYRDVYEPGDSRQVDDRYATFKPEPAPPAADPEASMTSKTTAELPLSTSTPGSMELTPEEKARVEDLKARDAAVRVHEMAHILAGGQYIIRRANYSHVLGPDGKLYAVGGDVQIDTSEVPGDPEATIRKAQAVRRAALAPANPSGQDLRVAAEATRMEFEARMELSRERAEEAQEQVEGSDEEGEVTMPESFRPDDTTRRTQSEYVVGSDGKLYAVGVDGQVDISEVPGDPEATIRKAQAIRREALGHANPSAEDLRVAAQATRMEFEARMELAHERAEEMQKQAEEYNQEGETVIPEAEPMLLNLFA